MRLNIISNRHSIESEYEKCCCCYFVSFFYSIFLFILFVLCSACCVWCVLVFQRAIKIGCACTMPVYLAWDGNTYSMCWAIICFITPLLVVVVGVVVAPFIRRCICIQNAFFLSCLNTFFYTSFAFIFLFFLFLFM